jgi:SAM-dependent methyltransferase
MEPGKKREHFWSAAADDWAVLQEPQHRPLWMAMQLAAGVGRGTRLLDAGCGAGGACFLAAHNYGADVWGFDASDELIKLARQRLPSGHFEVADLAAPPFAGESFHVVMTANALQFSPDPMAALRAWKERLIATKGSMVIGLWSPQDENEQIHIMRAVRAILPHPPEGGNPFALSPRGQVEEMMAQAGLKVKESRDVPLTFEYQDMETCWRASSSGSMQSAIQIVGEAPVKSAFMGAAQQFLMSDGSVFIHNKMRYVLGQNF